MFPIDYLSSSIIPEFLARSPTLMRKLQKLMVEDVDLIFASKALHEYQLLHKPNNTVRKRLQTDKKQ